MTDSELLAAILAELERLTFIGSAVVSGVGFLAAACLVGGWLYARRDSNF